MVMVVVWSRAVGSSTLYCTDISWRAIRLLTSRVFMNIARSGSFWFLAISLLLLVAVAALLYIYNPARTAFFPPCPFHYATGLYCPGCGSLRAMHSLLHLDIAGAFRMNALMVISIPFLLIIARRPRWIYHKWTPWVCFLVIVLYAVFRNLPQWPFSLFAPH